MSTMPTNSTSHTVGWAPEPQGRGTIGILWNCFATLILCTWSAVHPNFPALDENRFVILRRRFGVTVICLIAPELIAWSALLEKRSARETQRKRPGWSLAQCFFLNMGGFVVRLQNGQRRRVRPTVLLGLFQEGSLHWPETNNEDIEDRSKSNWLIKAFALIQIICFIAQLVGRWAQGLPATTLELFTLGIVTCAVVIYVVWWEKPFGLQIPVVLQCTKILPEDDFLGHVQSVYAIHPGEDRINWLLYYPYMILITLTFGAVHIAAWNFQFPSLAERLLWRISSIGVIAIPVLYVSSIMVQNTLITFRSLFHNVSLLASIVFYILFRLYMFVEMFISLRASPASVYQTPQWSQYFPSFG